jgi:hypothetical protein
MIVTDVPPVIGPAFGLDEVTTGCTTYVKTSDAFVGDVPKAVDTVTFTLPTLPAGASAVTVVAFTTVT